MRRSITETYLAQYRAVTAESDDSESLFPLTGAQRRFLLSRRLDSHGRPDIVPLFFSFPRGAIDAPRLRRAATLFAMRHTALCGAVTVLDGVPVLRAGPPSVEVREIGIRSGWTAMETLLHELRGWNPNGPALRLLLARGPRDEDELLALVLDHMVCDEQSLGLVTAGITEAYDERPGPAAAPAADGAAYREAVQLQLAAERAASLPASLTYWAARLGALTNPEPAHSGSDDGGSATPASNGMLDHRLPAAPGSMRGSVFPALLDAIATALRSVFGSDSVYALGYPWGGRPAMAPQVLGCFLNTVVYPASPKPAGIEEIEAGWWSDLDHADTPHDEVTRAVRAAGAPWSGSLDGMLTFEDLKRRPHLSLGGTIGQETYAALPRQYAAPFSIAASQGDDLLIRLVWNRGRLSDDDAHAALKTLLHTLRADLGTAAGSPSHAEAPPS